jgi:hypothetical protein
VIEVIFVIFTVVVFLLWVGVLVAYPFPSSAASVVVDYGYGVYYFDYTQARFANALAAFIKEHPELELVAMTGEAHGAYGHDNGYFVVFREER